MRVAPLIRRTLAPVGEGMRSTVSILTVGLAIALSGIISGSCSSSRRNRPQRVLPTREDTIRKLVSDFIVAHNRWEQSAIAKDSVPGLTRLENGICYFTEKGVKVSEEIVADYEKALSPFAADSVRLRCGGYGTPLKHDPQLETITSIVLRSETYVVTTRLTRRMAGVMMNDDYEYHVVIENGQPRLLQVLCLLDDGDSFNSL